MKVLLINKYHYFRGGSETYYFGLAKALENAGHEVFFFSAQDKRNLPCREEEYFVSGVEFNGNLSVKEKLRAGARMFYSFEAKKKLKSLIREKHPDIVHVGLFHRVLTASVIDAAWEEGIPVVFTMHDLNCICPNHTMQSHGQICEDCLHGNYLHCIKSVCFKGSRAKCAMAAAESAFNLRTGVYDRISLFITPSAFYKKKLEESGITKSPVIHIKNFLPEDTEYEWKGRRGDYILYYGRLSEEKGIMTLIDAVRMLPDVRLKIVGDGEKEEEIRKKVLEDGLEKRISLEGFKSGKDLHKYIDDAECVVVPSEWYEASGYTACEPQARGKIVIAADAGGLPENIIDGRTGFVYPMKDVGELARKIRMVREMTDEEYAKMSRNAVRSAKSMFLCSGYIKELTALYETLAKKGSVI